MCIDDMGTEGRKQRESRSNGFRRKTGVVEAAVRRSSRKPGRRSHSLASVKEKQKHSDALPSGAMAPRNTTQYLMEQVYSDLNITALSPKLSNCLPSQHEQTYSYNSRYTNEDTLDFQHRDFESVFFQNEIWIDAILTAAILGRGKKPRSPETCRLNLIKIKVRVDIVTQVRVTHYCVLLTFWEPCWRFLKSKSLFLLTHYIQTRVHLLALLVSQRHACAAGGSWLCGTRV